MLSRDLLWEHIEFLSLNSVSTGCILLGGLFVYHFLGKCYQGIHNYLFGLAFAVNGIGFLSLNSVSTGCILLGGLFVYDIFWVSVIKGSTITCLVWPLL